MKKSVAIIGVGKLATILAPHLASQFDLHLFASVTSSAWNNCQLLAQTVGAQIYQHPQEVPHCDYYLLGVKPQQLGEVISQWQNWWATDRTLVSLLAGVPVASLQRQCRFQRIVRLMPNIATEVGHGCTAIFHSVLGGGSDDRGDAITHWSGALTTSGRVIKCRSEQDFDLATIAAGSGPAFFLAFAKAQLDFFQHRQMDPALAREAVAMSMYGAAQLIFTKGDGQIPQLIQNVTSKGGITAAALASWQQHDFNTIVQNGLQAARDRLQQLDQRGDGT